MQVDMLFLILLIYFSDSLQPIYCKIVKLYEHSNLQGNSLDVPLNEEDASGCTNIPSKWIYAVSLIDTHGLCLHLYSERQCTGNKISLLAGTNRYHDLSKYWSNSINDDALHSIKVCNAKNHIREHIPSINIYINYKKLPMNISSCVNLPISRSNKITSIYNQESCFRFYSDENCQTQIYELHKSHSQRHISDRNLLKSIASIDSCKDKSDSSLDSTEENANWNSHSPRETKASEDDSAIFTTNGIQLETSKNKKTPQASFTTIGNNSTIRVTETRQENHTESFMYKILTSKIVFSVCIVLLLTLMFIGMYMYKSTKESGYTKISTRTEGNFIFLK